MRNWSIVLVFAVGVVAGCMAAGPPLPAQTPESGSPRTALVRTLSHPLILDRTDLRIGTTVQFDRLPTAGEVHDLALLPRLAHVVLALPEWPADLGPLEALSQMPEGADVVVVLPDYPPSRAHAERWNFVNAPLRIVVVVPGPPSDLNTVTDLNAMPRLERVIAQMDDPSRSGFERIQRPLSFRKVVE